MLKVQLTRGIVLAALLAITSTAQATIETWHIDPAQSSLGVGGTLAGTPAGSQNGASTSTHYQGTIKVDRTASTIQFVAGSVLDAILQASNQSPAPDSNGGSAA